MKTADDLKQAIARPEEFSLRASILWEYCCGYWLLPEQLQGICLSAEYFSFKFDEERLLNELDSIIEGLPAAPHVVNIEIARNGEMTLRTEESTEDRKAVTAALSNRPIDHDSPFLYHQTSHNVYAGIETDTPGIDEIIFWNNRGEITETVSANIVVEIDGLQITPPVSCGLHPGAYRAKLLADGRFVERPVHTEELQDCTKVFLINSLVGWREVSNLGQHDN